MKQRTTEGGGGVSFESSILAQVWSLLFGFRLTFSTFGGMLGLVIYASLLGVVVDVARVAFPVLLASCFTWVTTLNLLIGYVYGHISFLLGDVS